jgi:guanylate kinase
LERTNSEDLYSFARQPLLFVFSGTSGAGKDSVVKGVVKQMKERNAPVHFVVTATTRPKRDTEVEGVDYFFVSREQFEQMIADDELVEHALVYGQYKGVPKSQIEEALASGMDVVMRLDIQGAFTIRQLTSDAILIFVTTSSEQELVERLRQRHTETSEQLQIRIETARQEMSHISEFDYLILNREQRLEEAVEVARSIIVAEQHRIRTGSTGPIG